VCLTKLTEICTPSGRLHICSERIVLAKCPLRFRSARRCSNTKRFTLMRRNILKNLPAYHNVDNTRRQIELDADISNGGNQLVRSVVGR
jgi:hypothetical protein